MRWRGVAALALMLGLATPASAEIFIFIDKTSQSMSVSINGAPIYDWAVSTGTPGRDTPNGTYTAQRLERVYYSKKYDDAPMPNSVFFYEGYAIHGTLQENRLGTAASHGCVRLSRANAITLYNMVSAQGLRNTRVVVVGQTPPSNTPMARSYERDRYERPIESSYAPRGPRVIQQYGAYDSPRYAEPQRRVYWDDDRRPRERQVIQMEDPYPVRRAYRDYGGRY